MRRCLRFTGPLRMSRGFDRRLLIAVVALMCCARSAVRIDASSDDALLNSIELVRGSLSEDRRQRFEDSLSTISAAIQSKVDFTDVGIAADTTRATLRRVLNGKTGEEVIAYADDLKRGAQQVPQMATSAHDRVPLVVGDPADMSGNSFSHGVSARFGENELRRLHAELNGPVDKAKLQSYLCTPLPSFAITVVLYFEGPYEERRVRMQMTPPLYKTDGQIESGIGYLFEHGVHALDPGPPIDYGYRRPSDGAPLTPVHTDLYPEPQTPDCSKR